MSDDKGDNVGEENFGEGTSSEKEGVAKGRDGSDKKDNIDHESAEKEGSFKTEGSVKTGGTTVKLVSSDGDSFDVPLDVANLSVLVQSSLDGVEEDDTKEEIMLPKVGTAALEKTIDFCTHYQAEPMKEIEKPLISNVMGDMVQDWYAEFSSMEDVNLLFEVLQAANYMDIKPLLDLMCATVACVIHGKSSEELRRPYKILKDFSPEEEEQIRKENAWCEQA